ncbi:hypothetical protein ACTQ51_05350 [Candidatus Paralachnospira sp. LCP21S3_H12]
MNIKEKRMKQKKQPMTGDGRERRQQAEAEPETGKKAPPDQDGAS